MSYKEILDFLDDLRESGSTNMYGAPNILMNHFEDLTKRQAIDICLPYIHGELTEERFDQIMGY